jgi:hypothetical protein
MRTASRANRGARPASLRERLALLECGIVPVAPPREPSGARAKAGKRARSFARRGFLVGVICGGALGSATLLAALLTYPAQMRAHLRQAVALPQAIARLGAQPPASHPRREADEVGAPTRSAFEITIDRGLGGKVRLPLRVVGLAGAQNAEVLLRGLPAGAQLSRGERRAEGTWVLRPAELEDLQLTLGDGAPDAFYMMVEVASASGEEMAAAVAHVRLSDPHSLAHATEPRWSTATNPAVAPTADTEPPAQPAAAPRPPLPEGLSSLGGPTGDAASTPAPPQDHRAVWWKLPQQAWTPFADRLSEH